MPNLSTLASAEEVPTGIKPYDGDYEAEIDELKRLLGHKQGQYNELFDKTFDQIRELQEANDGYQKVVADLTKRLEAEKDDTVGRLKEYHYCASRSRELLKVVHPNSNEYDSQLLWEEYRELTKRMDALDAELALLEMGVNVP